MPFRIDQTFKHYQECPKTAKCPCLGTFFRFDLFYILRIGIDNAESFHEICDTSTRVLQNSLFTRLIVRFAPAAMLAHRRNVMHVQRLLKRTVHPRPTSVFINLPGKWPIAAAFLLVTPFMTNVSAGPLEAGAGAGRRRPCRMIRYITEP